MKIEKKNGSIEQFSDDKIIKAIRKSAERIGRELTDDECRFVVDGVKREVNASLIHVYDMHKIVCRVLKEHFPDVAHSYQNFRDYKLTYAKDFEKLFKQTKDVLYLGDRENANFDSALVSTKSSLIRGYITKMLYQNFYLTRPEREAISRGEIYIHDLRDMIMNSFNCCLFDIETVLRGGFTMANVQYSEPKSVLAALQVIGDVTLSATGQQSKF